MKWLLTYLYKSEGSQCTLSCVLASGLIWSSCFFFKLFCFDSLKDTWQTRQLTNNFSSQKKCPSVEDPDDKIDKNEDKWQTRKTKADIQLQQPEEINEIDLKFRRTIHLWTKLIIIQMKMKTSLFYEKAHNVCCLLSSSHLWILQPHQHFSSFSSLLL